MSWLDHWKVCQGGTRCSLSKSPSNSRVPSYSRKEMEVIPGGRNEKLECSGFARVTPGDRERGVPLLPTIPHFCISRSVESSAWPQLRISECGLFSKAGQHPELYRDENEARDPKSVGFEEDTTHTMFSNLGSKQKIHRATKPHLD